MHFGWRLGRAGHDAANDLGGGAPLEWRTAREDRVERGPQAVDVGPRDRAAVRPRAVRG